MVKILPTCPIKAVIKYVYDLYTYTIKYRKAWKAKQDAFRMLYGDWEESYNRIPFLLGGMAAANPGVSYVVEDMGAETMMHKGRRVTMFKRAF